MKSSPKYGAIVVATGFDTIKLDKYDEYAYSQSRMSSRPSSSGAS